MLHCSSEASQVCHYLEGEDDPTGLVGDDGRDAVWFENMGKS
jgi:hypothetical protein